MLWTRGKAFPIPMLSQPHALPEMRFARGDRAADATGQCPGRSGEGGMAVKRGRLRRRARCRAFVAGGALSLIPDVLAAAGKTTRRFYLRFGTPRR
jgi:hypothetical protein